MPIKPHRPCQYPGCSHITDDRSGYCPEHLKLTRRQYDSQRGTSSQRGYDTRWRHARRIYLRQHPLCVYCLAKEPEVIRAAVLIDHFIPHRGNMKLFWNESNWRASCDECHRVKTAKEDGAFGNVSKNRRND